jgi:hypothetical protein
VYYELYDTVKSIEYCITYYIELLKVCIFLVLFICVSISIRLSLAMAVGAGG